MNNTNPHRKTTRDWGIRIAFTVSLLALLSGPARGQWTPFATPEFEANGQFSFVRANGSNSSSFNVNGGGGAFTYNFKHWLAVVGDGEYYRFGGLPSGLTSNMITYAGGPRITFRSHAKFIPFVQVLAGGAHLTASSAGVTADENGLLLAPGAGVDLYIHHSFAIRAAQIDYMATRFGVSSGGSAFQNNFRISAGIVFRFGDR